MQLAPSLHRLGRSSLVNSYLIEDADALNGLTARWVLPGHGDPWTGGLPEALGIIRGRGRD
jgi:hypothetical protein